MMYVMVVAGFVLLLGGAEFLVRGAVALAKKFGMSPLLIGMTIVAFGTSAPEFVVSVEAALSGSPAMALGNVIGSNIANVLLILGVAGLIYPISMKTMALLRDGSVLLGSSMIFAVLVWLNALTLWSGVLLMAIYIAFLAYSYWVEANGKDPTAKLHEQEAEEFQDLPRTTWGMWGAVLAGGFAVAYGAKLLVTGGVDIARTFGVSEEVIGLTMIAFGTSLPELATSAVAAMRRHAEVAIGNVVGSNVINILGVAGLAAIFAPLPASAQIQTFDLWVMLASTVVLVAFLLGGWRLGRFYAGLFVVAYGAYIAMQAVGVSTVLGG